jgi:hypothetical protein
MIRIYNWDTGETMNVPEFTLSDWLREGWTTQPPSGTSDLFTQDVPAALERGTPSPDFEGGFVPDELTGGPAPAPSIDPDNIYAWTIVFTDPVAGPVTYARLRVLAADKNLPIQLPGWDASGNTGLTRGEFDKEFSTVLASILAGTFDPNDPLGFDLDLGLEPEAPRGRGGGVARAQYVPPDRRLVEDAAKAMLVALAGRSDMGRVNMLTDLYLSEDRRAFGRRDVEQIDPMEAVKEKIRSFEDYKAIHGLRPETEDEFTWVSQRRGALLRAGVTPTEAQELAIEQATVAATGEQTAQAGQVSEFQRTGQFLPGFFQNVRSSAASATRLL